MEVGLGSCAAWNIKWLNLGSLRGQQRDGLKRGKCVILTETIYKQQGKAGAALGLARTTGVCLTGNTTNWKRCTSLFSKYPSVGIRFWAELLVMEDEEKLFTCFCVLDTTHAFGSIGLNSAQMQPYPKFQEFIETKFHWFPTASWPEFHSNRATELQQLILD